MTKTEEPTIQERANASYQNFASDGGRMARLYDQARELGHDDWADDLETQIQEMPLCVDMVEIRPNREEVDWQILLGTGGPARRVLVTTDYRGEVESTSYQYQDWFTLWTDAWDQDDEMVTRFAQCFYFGSVSVSVDGSES